MFFSLSLFAQKNATITEEIREFKTYPFSDPDPSPILIGKQKKIYPYFRFDGYTTTSQNQKWKVVKLKNDYIELYILPEVGGKIWGAIEKSTGKEFLYSNDVVKFRDVASRGAWTSGGIEFNFGGIIGHHTGTAKPVDYTTRINPDGSVSCFVGTLDLPSRMQWRVEIRLPKDKAYFETKVLWNNASPLPQPYYSWMTAAAATSDDLEFFYPGNETLEHEGMAKPWPIDKEGHNLSKYPENAFGTHKSIHTVGEYNDFMGGYYHKSNFGFGHWALYDEMPGHKFWLWALSREGAIWEDLLTDTHGQYMEFQAGRQFNQYAQTVFRSPIKEANFPPNLTDRWREIWFPVKEIGGLLDVSESGILNLKQENENLQVAINALAFADAKIIVKSGDKVVFTQNKSFKPMEVFKTDIPMVKDAKFEVVVEGMDLHYKNEPKEFIKRQFVTTTPADTTSASYIYQIAIEQKEIRDYKLAKESFKKCLKKDSFYIDAMVNLIELHYRSCQYDEALRYGNQALQLDTYHPAANYYTGITYIAKGDFVNGLEALGWAARSAEFRTAAYTQMAGIEMQLKNPSLAVHYANQALDYDRYNMSAMKILAVAYRKLGNTEQADAIAKEIDNLDPLNHFAHFEKSLLHPSAENENAFAKAIQSEFSYQTYLEVFMEYYDLGIDDDALKVLEKAPNHPLLTIWKAFLTKDESLLEKVANESPGFVFPYRTETVPALEWAVSKNKNWKFNYYLGLNYWAIDRIDEATKLFQACGNEPDFAPFYVSRAFLLNSIDKKQELVDLQKAKQVDPNDWRNWEKLTVGYENIPDNKMALATSKEASSKFKGNSVLELQYARAQLNNNQYEASIKTLEKIKIIPFEGSIQGKFAYEQTYLNLAVDLMSKKKYSEAIAKLEKAKEWPENLGAGKPYEPDNRFEDYLGAICLDKLNKPTQAAALRNEVINYSNAHYDYFRASFCNLFAMKILQSKGENEKANELSQKIKDLPKFNESLVHKWVIATYGNDLKVAENLEKELATDNYFKIIIKIQELEK